MRRFTRYVLVEYLKVFLLTLTALTVLIILFGIAREAKNQGLGPLQIVQIVPYILPDALRFTLPGTVLFAACLVFGRLSGSNEIVAIKSLGISPWVVLAPVFALAFLLSLAAVWVNDLAVTWGYRGVQTVILNSVEEIVYGMLRSQRSYSSQRFSIIVKRVDGRKLISPVFTFEGHGDNPAVTVRVEEAELKADPANKSLTILCRNGTVEVHGQVTVAFDDSFTRTIPLADASRAEQRSNHPALMSLRAIRDARADETQRLLDYQQQLAARGAFELAQGNLRSVSSETWCGHQQAMRDIRNRIYRLATEPYRRWANGFSCLCFALVGAPMAIRLRNSDFLTSFFVCFLPILVVYYPLMLGGVDGAKNGTLPPYGVWLGNLLLTIWGVWLLRRVLRY